jgi:microcystin degradation protein MlrC
MKRIAIGGISHETNTYADQSWGPTTLASFRTQLHGDDILKFGEDTDTEYGGAIVAARERNVELVPLFDAIANPSGTIERDTYETLADLLINKLQNEGPFDGCYLRLHGAGVVEGIPDLEGDLGVRVRNVIGNIPLVATLDLHANVSDTMIDVFDVLIGYRLYPHTDMADRGHDAMNVMCDMLDGKIHPTMIVEHIPMLLPTSSTNPGLPAHEMNRLCEEIRTREGVIDCSVMHGFPYTDIADVGVHVLVITDNNVELATAAGREVGAWIWDHREAFRPEGLTSELAVRQALATSGTVLINETSDNPGGGSPGDGTHLLRALLEADRGNARTTFGYILDPAVVQQAIASGVGTKIQIALGGKHDELHGQPIHATAYVKLITDGRFVLRAMGRGVPMHVGPMVRLEIDGVSVLVSSYSSQTFDEAVFELHGIDVRTYDVVCLKSSQHFRAGFQHLVDTIITADSPGLTTLRVEQFERTNHLRPMWPMHPEARYGTFETKS